MANPPEIARPPFIFRDAFFVDLGPGKRHARASDSELRALLLPAAKAAPPKDQVAHYYEAQLLHYGLARTKDKNLAKVRLTKALSEAGKGGLQLPADVKRLEEEMKKEWTKEVRKAAKADKAVTVPPVAAGGKKRKAADTEVDEGPSTATAFKARVTVEFDVPGANASKTKATPKKAKTETTPALRAPAVKKQKAETTNIKAAPAATAAKKAKAETGAKDAPTTASTRKPKTESTAVRGASSGTRGGKKATNAARPTAGTAPTSSAESSTPRPKQTARRSAPFMANNPSYRPQPHSPSPDMMDLDDPEDAPPPYDSLGFNSYNDPPPTQSEKRSSVQITGHYDIEIDLKNSDYGDVTPKLVLVVDTDRQELWGAFSGPGDHECILWGERIEHASNGDVRVELGWRAQWWSSGQYLFRRDNRGVVVLDGAGGLSGMINGLLGGEDVELRGDLTHSYSVPAVEELRNEWDAIPRRAYGRR